ncbi:hypothetical protein [Nocardia sp. NPDC047038]|uniref:hypothetical protein n=1 Tax=Nocardia sp. NPDC047038 TaxID=3154338 RepID=UPI0034032BB8
MTEIATIRMMTPFRQPLRRRAAIVGRLDVAAMQMAHQGSETSALWSCRTCIPDLDPWSRTDLSHVVRATCHDGPFGHAGPIPGDYFVAI